MKKDEILEPLPKGTDLNDLPSGVYKPRNVGKLNLEDINTQLQRFFDLANAHLEVVKMELISREELKYVITSIIKGVDEEVSSWDEKESREMAVHKAVMSKCVEAMTILAGVIDQMPTIESRQKGEWIESDWTDEGRTMITCPKCDNNRVVLLHYRPNFCDNCGTELGAGMGGEE